MRSFVFSAAILSVEVLGKSSFCETLHADDIPQFCKCTDTTKGGDFACHIEALEIEKLDLSVKFEPCASPAMMYFDFSESARGVHKNFEKEAGFDGPVTIDRLHVSIPRVGNLTAVANVKFEANPSHLEASVSLDACGVVLGHEGCASQVPRSPLPFQVLDMNRNMSDFCASLLSSVAV